MSIDDQEELAQEVEEALVPRVHDYANNLVPGGDGTSVVAMCQMVVAWPYAILLDRGAVESSRVTCDACMQAHIALAQHQQPRYSKSSGST